MTDAGVLVISAARRPLDLTSLWRKVEVREVRSPWAPPLNLWPAASEQFSRSGRGSRRSY